MCITFISVQCVDSYFLEFQFYSYFVVVIVVCRDHAQTYLSLGLSSKKSRHQNFGDMLNMTYFDFMLCPVFLVLF